jgi:hypothetical protein
MTPFVYPKTKHTRTQKPKQYSDYKSYKNVLRVEFHRKCVYCRAPDTNAPRRDGFGVDHYRPKSLFPDLATVYENLYYCCNGCNSRKRSYWPTKENEGKLFVPNPCEHEMYKHLRFKDDMVEGRTAAGEFAIKLLDLNDPTVVGFRQSVTHLVDVTSAQLQRLNKVHTQLSVLADKGCENRDMLLTRIQQVEANIAKAKRALEQLTAQHF